MALSTQDIQQVAHLARIEINEKDAVSALEKLSGILNLIEKMQSVDTSGIVPMSHSQDVTQRLREDVITYQNQREALQKNVPLIGNGATEQALANGLFLVPKVIE